MIITGTQEEIDSIRRNCYAECEGRVFKEFEECPVCEDQIEVVTDDN
jgi:hypothetical protein